MIIMASIDLSVQSFLLISVGNVNLGRHWHLSAKIGLILSCILSMQALNYIRYIMVGYRFSFYT